MGEKRKQQRGSFLDWLLTLGVIAVAAVLFSLALKANTERYGRDAFPSWMWRIYNACHRSR